MQTLLINAEKKRVSRLETAAAALGLPAMIPRQGTPSQSKSTANPERAAAPRKSPRYEQSTTVQRKTEH